MEFKRGDIVKLTVGCGVVLDIYKNGTGEAILKILVSKNVIKLQEPELIAFNAATELGITIIDETTLYADLVERRKWYQKEFNKRLDTLFSEINKAVINATNLSEFLMNSPFLGSEIPIEREGHTQGDGELNES